MTRQTGVVLLALVANATSVRSVHAQKPDDPQALTDQAALADAVELENGAYLRGLILEVDPESHLSIRLPTGEVRKIPIGEVLSAERAGRPVRLPGRTQEPPPAATTAPATVPAPTGNGKSPAQAAPKPGPAAPVPELDRLLAAVPGPRVKLTVTANRDAYLQRQIGSGEEGDLVAYHLVCRLPCQLELPALDPIRYRVDGRRTEATAWFQLPRHDGRIEADLVSDMWRLWPKALLVGSVLFGAAGGIMVGAHYATDGATWVRDTGFVLGGVGGGLLVGSGLVLLFKPETSYSIEPAR